MSGSNIDTGAQKGMEINVAYLFKIIFAKWWIILLVAVFAASSGFVTAELTKAPTYTSSISFVVSNRLLTSEDAYSSSDINASITMANTYKYILSSRTLCEKVAKTCGIPNITANDVSKIIKMSTVTNTNIIVMQITTDSSVRSYNLAVSVIENFGEVVDTAGFTNSTLSVCELPNLPTAPDINTSGLRYAVVGAFAGIVLSLVVIMLINVSKDTIQSVDEIAARLNINVLGVVGRINRKGAERSDPLLMDENNTGFAFIETYKSMRTKIENLSAKKGCKVFVVSSAGENEGKTTVATNTAIALAQNGRSVLLIDADLRKPSVCKLLSLTNSKDNKGHGLPDVILNLGIFEKAIRYVEKHKLFLLAGTSVVADPTEMLSMPQTGRIIKAARNEFDFVIIDTAPAGVVTDASIITNYADAMIFVIREDQSSVERIKITLSDLSNGKAIVAGCVYNNVTSNIGRNLYRYGRYGRYGRYYGGYYGNGYGYGYGYDLGKKEAPADVEKDDNDDEDYDGE